MLGDGTEVLTDSDDTEMFDYDEEEGDTEVLDKDGTSGGSKHAKTTAKSSQAESKVGEKEEPSKDAGVTEAVPPKSEPEKTNAHGSAAK
ncbi:hypothetical protein ABW19_dt0200857 [Dactylella cylindrospora]|nr:hypothetical protein ABW19_dt0200857 [Dactylella cylindrospora]